VAPAPAAAHPRAESDGPAESDGLASPDEAGAVGEVGQASPPGWEPRPDPGSVEAFTALFDTYARHVFDYCSSLLGDQAEAAAATRATLIAACLLVERLDSRFRLRAWLLALARTECNSRHPGRAEPLPPGGLGLFELTSSRQREGDEIADTGPGELSSDVDASDGREAPVLAALGALPVLQREVLELVYRHGVRPAELPAILGISPDHAQTLLTDAVRSFEQAPWFPADTAEGPDKDVDCGQLAVEQLGSLPMASLPASLWGRTFWAVFDPDAGSYRDAVAARQGPLGPDGFPDQQTRSAKPARKRLTTVSMLLAALVLAPVAAGAALYSYFSGAPDAQARSHSRVLAPNPTTNPPSPSQAGPHQIVVHRHRTHVRAHYFAGAPPPAPSPANEPSQTSPVPPITKPGPRSSPSPTKPPSPSPSGSPTSSSPPPPSPTPPLTSSATA
jgi:DNA-directed RNA polymerase specialized sigma24 family protein